MTAVMAVPGKLIYKITPNCEELIPHPKSPTECLHIKNTRQAKYI
jgi:hypothetical protein